MRSVLAALLLVPTLPAWAGEGLTLEHERYTLDNGLEVVLAPDTSAPIVHTQVWYHVGSKDEEQGLTGFAHLFEHLMFNGSLNAPGDYFEPLQAVGANLNGTTNSDRTNYFETVPSRYLPLALFMESDRMGHLLEVLDVTKLDNQRMVVRNERRQRYENPPYGEVWPTLLAALAPEGHPYHHATIGSHEDLENASLDDVKAFFRTWYGPNNASLVVTGDFDVDTAKALVEENFGWIPAAPPVTRQAAAPVVLGEDVVIRQADDVPDARVWLAWNTPAHYADGDAAFDILASLLCDGKSSRLVDTIVRTQRVARDLSCYQASRQLGSVFVIDATAAEGHTTDEVVTAIQAQLDAVLGDQPPTVDEITAAVADFEVGFYRRLSTIAGRAGAMSTYLHYVGEPDWVGEDLGRYTSLTPDAILTAVRSPLEAHRVALHIVPAEGGAE